MQKTHLFLIFSHISFLPALIASYHVSTLICMLLVTVCVASIGMHMSDTKHELDPGPCLQPWSNFCLNTDRFVAAFASGYLIFETRNKITQIHLLIVLVGACFLWFGEKTTNAFFYAIFHSIWHCAMFYCAWDLLKS